MKQECMSLCASAPMCVQNGIQGMLYCPHLQYSLPLVVIDNIIILVIIRKMTSLWIFCSTDKVDQVFDHSKLDGCDLCNCLRWHFMLHTGASPFGYVLCQALSSAQTMSPSRYQ